MTPKKGTLMATLLAGIDFKNVSLLFEIHMGKITQPRSKKINCHVGQKDEDGYYAE